MRVKIMGLNQYTVAGKTYQYWRRKGAPQIRIDPPLKGAALAQEIARLEAKFIRPKSIAGSLRHLVTAYKKGSHHWAGIRSRTKRDYERVFAWLGNGGLDAGLHEYTPPEIAKIRDRAAQEHEPKFANQVVTVLKMVFAFGYEQGIMRDNPAKGISKLTGGNKRRNRACTPQEAVALLDQAPIALIPIIALALHTGFRLGDIATLSKSADKGEWLEHIQSKTRGKVRLWICEDLRWILDGIPANDATQLCVKANGLPWAYEGIKTAFQRHRDALEFAGAVGEGVTFHGLRHTVATILSEAGYSENEFAHQMGHGPKTISGHYARSAAHEDLLKNMAETIENVLREARGNVVKLNTSATKSS